MKVPIAVSMNCREEDGCRQAYLDEPYLDLLAVHGALPLPMALTDDGAQLEAMLDLVGGVMLTGGRDLNPGLWGEAPHAQTQLLHPWRQQCEFALYERAQRRQLPILGICLGFQIINVANGGSLWQHLPDRAGTVDHRGNAEPARHAVKLDEQSRLRQWLGTERITVNSFHHQGLKRLGQGLRAMAWAEDGIVEAIEQPGYPFLLAVQWHPEREIDNRVNQVLMEHFLEAAERRAWIVERKT